MPGPIKDIREYSQWTGGKLQNTHWMLQFSVTQAGVVATVSQPQIKVFKTLYSAREIKCKSLTYTYSATCPFLVTRGFPPLPTSSVLLALWWKEQPACRSLLLFYHEMFLVLDKTHQWESAHLGRPPFLLKCTSTNPNSVKGYWWSGCLSKNDGPGGKQKPCIVSNQEMSADLRETLQTHQSTETNIKTNGVFVKRCVFAQKGK